MSLGRVLIVDDEPDLRKAVRLTLTKAGYEVIEAEDGEKGIAAVKWGDNPLLLGTIICDLQMPKVSGAEAIAFFREQFPSVPIIVMSGAGTLDIASELYRQGVVEYLAKPVKADMLVRAVERAMRLKD